MGNFNTDDYSLAELEKMFDKYYRYSDDHSVFTKHSNIEQAIHYRKEAAKEQNMEESDV